MPENPHIFSSSVALLGTIPGLATSGEMTLYVDDATGDDGNPGTRLLPLKTIVEARSRVPLYIRHTVRIFVADHTGAGYEWPIFGPHILEKNLHAHGGWRLYNPGTGKWDEDPLHTGKNIIVPSTAAGAGSTALVVKSGGLAVNAYQGKYIEILSGPAAGDVRSIRNNTATDIVPDVDFSAVVAAGNNYQIFDSTVKVINSSGNFAQRLAQGVGILTSKYSGNNERVSYGLFIENIEISGGGFYGIINEDSVVRGYGVKLNSGFGSNAISSRGNLCFGVDFSDSWGGNPASLAPAVWADYGLPAVTSWSGWGLTCDDLLLENVDTFVASVIILGNFNLLAASNFRLLGGFFRALNNGFISEAPSTRGKRNGWIYCGHAQRFLVVNADAVPAIQNFYGDLYLQAIDLTSAGDGIVCSHEGYAMVHDVTGNATGIGLRTKYGGTIRVDHPVSIVGAAGDWSFNDGLTVHTNAELVNNSVWTDILYGKILRKDV
jgi:hypothetical protein